jgi:hypothetical protein
MKWTWSGISRKFVLRAVFAAGLLAVLTPTAAWADGHGRPGYGGRGYSGGGHAYYGGGRAYNYGRPYYGGSRFYLGFGYAPAPYAYGPGYVYAPPRPCAPAGYYDRWGRWRIYPGCAVVPYGY